MLMMLASVGWTDRAGAGAGGSRPALLMLDTSPFMRDCVCVRACDGCRQRGVTRHILPQRFLNAWIHPQRALLFGVHIGP